MMERVLCVRLHTEAQIYLSHRVYVNVCVCVCVCMGDRERKTERERGRELFGHPQGDKASAPLS